MSSKTKIVVLHMKEIIYTAIFALLGIALLLLLLFMFLPKAKETNATSAKYHPGVYTSSLQLNNADLSVEVTVDESGITAVRFANLDDTVLASYPLLQPAMEEIAQQIVDTQSLEDIQFSQDSVYTSQVILNTIDDAVKQSLSE